MSWVPGKEWIEKSNVYQYMISRNIPDLEKFHEFTYSEAFWDDFVKNVLKLNFEKPYTQTLDLSKGKQWAKWFVDGKINITNQLEETSKPLVRWMNERGESKTLTYNQVLYESKAVSSWLKRRYKKGDRIGIYLPMIPEIIPIFLGIIRAGMIVVPLFSGFGKEPIKVRLEDSEMKAIFTTDLTTRKDKEINPTENLEDFQVDKIVVERGGKPKVNYISYDEVKKTPGDGLEKTASEDPLMIIYTSGTTGKPKGCVHVHMGFPIKAAADIYFQFDMKNGELLTWITDLGWMMGPWLIFGGILLRGQIGLYEGYPGFDQISHFTEDFKPGILGLSASLVRSFKGREGKLQVRLAGNTGEPIDPESWNYLYRLIDHNPIINYSGGTEISGGILGNYVIKEIKASSFNGPSPGTKADVFDESGERAPPNTEGELVVLSVWPGMTRGFWRDEKRYLETYWSKWDNVWVHGDLAYYDNHGYFYIVGRSDDTIKVSGKRVGPAEIESVINTHQKVLESACVGIPDPLKGEKIICFTVTKEEINENELINFAQDKLGKAFSPDRIFLVKELPKTRNAKIMRRLLRAIILDKPLGDISSLENPSAVEEIRKVVKG
ncbi:AMP-dependent synthetase [Sulfolobus acidocaldarius SUSAZ]|nr:AMP-dependent synthetase [Sulfolobus acidocaldarius SUSAZ]